MSLGQPDPPGTLDRADGVLLGLATGRSDIRKIAAPGDDHYRVGLYALDRQDTWSGYEHREYWESHLHLWPGRRGNQRVDDAIVMVLANAIDAGINPGQILLDAGYQRNDSRWARWIRAAQDATREHRPDGYTYHAPVLLPRVVELVEPAPAQPLFPGGVVNVRHWHVTEGFSPTQQGAFLRMQTALGRAVVNAHRAIAESAGGDTSR